MTRKRKRVKRLLYEGLGFPIELRNAELVAFRGAWAPAVKLNELSSKAFLALATKPARLTGDEVRFIRQRMRSTLQAFAERLRVTHPAVMRWERAGGDPTGMAWGTEVAIRLEVVEASLGDAPRAFHERYRVIAGLSLEDAEEVVMVHDPEDPDLGVVGYEVPEAMPAHGGRSRPATHR